MRVFSEDEAARLCELLQQELEGFSGILKLINEQTASIEADNTDNFIETLDRTQELITIIDGLHRESNELMQSYKSHAGTIGEGKTTEIDTIYGKLESIIVECAGLIEKNTIAAKEKNQDYIERIGRLNLNRKSIGSYIQKVASAPEIFDKKM